MTSLGILNRLLNTDSVSKYESDIYVKQRHEKILHSIVQAAGMTPDCDGNYLYWQLDKVPCIISKLKMAAGKQAKEYIPEGIKRQLKQYERDDRELHIQIAELQGVDYKLRCKIDDLNKEHNEEVKKLKERIEFLENTKEKIYVLKEFK